MVLTDPEFESSVLISSDEGASYQKYRLTFYVLSLLFHPTEEDWALAYSHDQKVRPHLMSSPFFLYLHVIHFEMSLVIHGEYSPGYVLLIIVANYLVAGQ